MYTKLFDSDKGNMLCTTTPQNSAWNMLSQVVDGEPVFVMCVCFVSLPTLLCTCVLSLYLRLCYCNGHHLKLTKVRHYRTLVLPSTNISFFVSCSNILTVWSILMRPAKDREISSRTDSRRCFHVSCCQARVWPSGLIVQGR